MRTDYCTCTIFGHPLIHFAHRADVVRLEKLLCIDGIYLDCDFLLCYRSVPGALLGLAMRHGLPTGTVVVAFVDFLITFVTLILR